MTDDKDKGLYNKYIITRRDGTPIDRGNEYFVLKLDGYGNFNHIDACRAALMTYADEIESHNPKLAKDLRRKYSS